MPFKDPAKQREYFRQYDTKRRSDPVRREARRRAYYAEVAALGRDAINLRNRKNIEKRLEFYKSWRRKHKGLPEPTRPEPPFCECCGGPPKAGMSLCLDHDHSTGAFRGWLCHNCNLGLGYLGDTLERAKKAVLYLELTELL